MKTRHFLLILFAFSLSAVKAYASPITGVVIDENNQPLMFANVVLYALPDSTFVEGTLTNEQGAFHFANNIDAQNYVEISLIGYTKKVLQSAIGNVGVIAIASDAVVLGEVVVKGNRPTFKVKDGSLITNVQNTLLSDIGTSNDVIKRIPGVLVSHDKTIEVFGKGVPLIYINGRLIRDNSELEQLSSKDIAEIELITNPGAEYDAEVKSVLRIKTVKLVGEGVGGYARASIDYAKGLEHMEQMNLNYRKGGFDIFGSVVNIQSQLVQDESVDMQLYGNTLWELKDKSTIKADKYCGIMAQGGANYIFNEKHSIGVNYEFMRMPYSGDISAVQYYNVYADGNEYDRVTSIMDMSKERSTHKVNFYYSGKIAGRLGLDFNFDFLYGKNENGQNTEENSSMQESRHVTSMSNSTNHLYAGKLLLSYPIWKGSLKFGGEVSSTNRVDTYYNKEEIIPSSDSNVKEEKFAGFVSYSIEFGKNSLNAGLRYEHINYDYYEGSVLQDDKSRTYNNIFPNLMFSFPIERVNNSISYTIKTLRPRYEQLDGNVQYSNRFMYKQGNPLLQPETLHDVTYMGGWRFINYSLSYQYIKDFIGMERSFYNEEGSISLDKSRNYNKNQKLNLMLSVSPTIDFWHPSFTVYVSQQFFETEYRGKTMKHNNPIAYFTLNNDFTLPYDIVLSLNANYHTEGSNGIIQEIQSGSVDIGVRKSFLKNQLSVNIQGTDIFHTSRRGGTQYSPVCTNSYKDIFNSRKIILSVMYRFNAGQNKYKGTGAANDEMNRF